jgi:rare lipoprotein A
MSPEKGGALRTRTTGGRRAALALLSSAAIVVAPLVLLHGPAPASGAVAHRAPGASAYGAPGGHQPSAVPTGAASELVGYRADPSVPYFPAGGSTAATAATPATTAVPAPTTTTAPPPTTTTTTTVPPPTTTAAPAPVTLTGADGSTTGEATWYSEAPPGGCASPTLPFGTEVQVTNDGNGATTSCVVDDREASNPGRVLDMSYSGFSAIADPTQGVVTVTLTW